MRDEHLVPGQASFAAEFVRPQDRDDGLLALYNGHLEVHSSLLNVVLHDQPQISGGHAAAGSSDAKVA